MIVRARVRRGTLALDEELGEGRAALEASIERARAQGERGEGVDGTAYLAHLRRSVHERRVRRPSASRDPVR